MLKDKLATFKELYVKENLNAEIRPQEEEATNVSKKEKRSKKVSEFGHKRVHESGTWPDLICFLKGSELFNKVSMHCSQHTHTIGEIFAQIPKKHFLRLSHVWK